MWYCDTCLDKWETYCEHERLLHLMLMVNRQRAHQLIAILENNELGFLIASFVVVLSE